MHEKTCRTCNESKPLSAYYKNEGMADGHRHECKPCSRDKAAAHRVRLKADARRRRGGVKASFETMSPLERDMRGWKRALRWGSDGDVNPRSVATRQRHPAYE